MTTDFRALCAEMAAAWDSYSYADAGDATDRMTQIVNEARAALSAPEQGPTDAELIQLAIDTRLYRFQSTAGDPVQYEMTEQQVHAFARAVLARWGRPAGEPVPMSERLPGPEDCDARGRCWLCGKVEGDWRLINSANSGVPHLKYCFSHWLPHWALPLQQEGADGQH